jgi:hypothetical protein
MKMRMTMIMGMVLAGSVLTLYAEEGAMPEKSAMPKMDMEKKAAMAQEVYVCADCHVLSTKAGKCPMCGKEMTAQHLLGVKDGEALLCACGPGCKCDAMGMKDGKCACGKEVKKMSAKGMYVCPQGCPMISDKAGKCPGCGEEMKKVE